MPAPPLHGRRHREIAASLARMAAESRLPQTLLFVGPEGVGKATVARHLAAGINCSAGPGLACGDCSACARILSADLSLPEYRKQLAERKKLPGAKRSEAPLVIATHTDVLIFPPDGPMEMIGIEQAKALRKAARFSPSEGRRRVFIVEHADRANKDAANALLKTLEEPAPSLTIVLTTEHLYRLPSTIRSRAVPFFFPALTRDEMAAFLERRADIDSDVRDKVSTWAQGSPGAALALDVDAFLRRREAMLALIRTALSRGEFAQLSAEIEALARKPSESAEAMIAMIASLLRDLLRARLRVDEELIHRDIAGELADLAPRASFAWTERAVVTLDDLDASRHTNIQRQIAFEAYALRLQA